MINYSTTATTAAAGVCTPELFDNIMASNTVISNCNHMKELAEKLLPEHPSTDDWNAFKQAIGKYKKGSREEGIEGLPGFLFNATFPGGRRSKKDAVLTGLVVIDIDDVEHPREQFTAIKDDAIDMQLALAYISPSSKGLKLVFVVPKESKSLWDAQQMICKKLGMSDLLDSQCKDASRLSFASPKDYVLYRDDDLLFSDHQIPEGFNAQGESSEAIAPTVEIAPVEEISQDEEVMYKGLPMSKIIERLSIRLCGKTEPEPGVRNTMLLKAVSYVRTICDNDINKVMSVMPRWGQSESEWQATIKSAFTQRMYENRYQVMESIVAELKAEEAETEGKDNAWTLPAVPEVLPPGFAEIGKYCPAELKPGMMILTASAFGVYGSDAQVNISRDDEREEYLTPSFLCCVVGSPASGKGNFTYVYNDLTRRIRNAEKGNYAKQNEFNANRKNGNGRKLPPPIRLLTPTISKTALTQQLSANKGRHCYQFTPEIDDFATSNGSGSFNDLSIFMRKSSDNDRVGQIYMSADSYCTNVRIYLSMFMLAQPQSMYKFFNRRNVANGLVDRVFFAPLPDNTGMEEIKMKKMSDEDKEKINHVIDLLEMVGVTRKKAVYDDDGCELEAPEIDRETFELPLTLKALRDRQDYYRQKYTKSLTNPSEEHFMRRALQIGAKVGLVAYLANGMKEDQAVIDLAVWAFEYDLKSHVKLFGKTWNEIQEAGKKSINPSMAGLKNDNIFDALPSEFTTKDLVAIETSKSIIDSNPGMKIAKWKKLGLILARNSGHNQKVFTKVA